MKRPYPLPNRSRQWMIDYVLNHQLYHPMNSWNGGVTLAWDIKVHSFDSSGKAAREDYPVEDRFDAQWGAHLEEHESDLFWRASESALSYYLEGLWTPWPGPGKVKGTSREWRQGDFKFTVNGRSGGYLILTEWPGPEPREWALYPMIWSSRGSLQDWLEGCSWKELRMLHEVMADLDHCTRDEAIRGEMAYQFTFLRHQWEEALLAEEDEAVRKLEASRPDMYETA